MRFRLRKGVRSSVYRPGQVVSRQYAERYPSLVLRERAKPAPKPGPKKPPKPGPKKPPKPPPPPPPPPPKGPPVVEPGEEVEFGLVYPDPERPRRGRRSRKLWLKVIVRAPRRERLDALGDRVLRDLAAGRTVPGLVAVDWQRTGQRGAVYRGAKAHRAARDLTAAFRAGGVVRVGIVRK